MRRVLAFFEYQANNWKQKAFNLENTSLTTAITEPALAQANLQFQKIIREGKIAYAYRQANIRDQMRVHFSNQWAKLSPKLLYMDNADAQVRIECH